MGKDLWTFGGGLGFPLSIQGLFFAWKSPSHNDFLNNLWVFILLNLCWGVWKERNDRIFRGKDSTSIKIFHKSKHTVIEKIRITGKGQEPQDGWEAKVIQN